ncbi:terpenoid cyclases/protein prenyltransferase alpha-alpha toroid [Endogone sp. FLAS-F59071]|nr:terpenoid cyclases/protein prenyltransferase alpha-alpha toroid [Endogone sp. FLAS-F59071]|eukprot:RUS16602.1 terpenoid cyclases/protein prenyltransferase alpha-alpha toroid [Endogone sp. FLAS-F59071]
MEETYASARLNAVESPTFSNLSRWRLKVEHGAQTWHYLGTDEELKEWPQTKADKYSIGVPFDSPVFPKPQKPLESARIGYEYYKQLQTEDGHWVSEYGGPMFLLPGLIITYYITGTPVPEHMRVEIIRYLLNRAHPDDGGWGIHIEGVSTVFGTALNYVTLRILGLGPDHPAMIKARATLHRHGGAVGIPAWGKFWLAAMSVYDWEGVNSIPPELWFVIFTFILPCTFESLATIRPLSFLFFFVAFPSRVLPHFLPLHSGRWWVHTRMVYLPMGYIYARRLSPEPTTFIMQLRQELYVEPYESISWKKQRNNVAEVDLFLPHSKLMDFLYKVLSVYEMIPAAYNPLRKYALDVTLDLIRREDENTFYLDLGPVNKALNWLVTYYHYGRESHEFKEHVRRNADFMWLGAEGMMMNGTNGSQLWDVTFIAQAVCEAGLADNEENKESILKTLDFLDDCQIKRNVPEYQKCYRQTSKGAWPFSTRDQGYTVSDCTAEGLKTSIYLQGLSYTPKPITVERLQDAVDVLLTMQNRDGGFASYEPIRGPAWLELLNPAEVFGNIMIEYSYPECTTAVLLGLSMFRKHYPDYRSEEIETTVQNAIRYIKNAQREDGSWFGAWAICFTYAGMFALDSLASVGETYENSESSKRGCDFLISKQEADGGWGESYKACETGVYHHHAKSQVVNTAWACLALMAAKYPDEAPIRRGIQLIMSRQQANGEWLQEAIEGVFNKNCMISYPNYKFSFTIWALGRYAKRYGNPNLIA